MSIVERFSPLSIQAYIESEQRSDARHEYVGGAVYAMVGASTRHNLLCMELGGALRNHLRQRSCYTFQSDMKIRVDDVFYYPDIAVVCGEIDLSAYYQTSPVLVIEVLSESTESRDRLEKRIVYQRIPSLLEYALVAQDKMKIEIYRRIDDGWEIETFDDHDIMCFKSVGLTLPVREIYQPVIR